MKPYSLYKKDQSYVFYIDPDAEYQKVDYFDETNCSGEIHHKTIQECRQLYSTLLYKGFISPSNVVECKGRNCVKHKKYGYIGIN